MKARWAVIAVVLVASVLFVAGCKPEPEDPQELQIRTYEIPKGLDKSEFVRLLVHSFDMGDEVLGRVKELPDGRVVVTAPASVQVSIDDLVADLARRRPAEPEPTPASVTISYWFLLGRPRDGGGVEVASPTLERNAEIRPVLDGIVRAQGDTQFELLESLQLKSLDNGTHAAIRGRRISAEQRVMEHGGNERLADIKITIFGPRGVRHTLESRIKLEPGRYVVLGQTAYNDKGEQPAALESLDEDLMLYYVISSEID